MTYEENSIFRECIMTDLLNEWFSNVVMTRCLRAAEWLPDELLPVVMELERKRTISYQVVLCLIVRVDV